MKMKQNSRSIYRWFGISLLVILFMSCWIKGLYEDIDNVEFDNTVQSIYINDKDSIIGLLNNRVDSLKRNVPIVVPVVKPVYKPKKIVIDTIVKLDSLITKPDTIK